MWGTVVPSHISPTFRDFGGKGKEPMFRLIVVELLHRKTYKMSGSKIREKHHKLITLTRKWGNMADKIDSKKKLS